MRASCLIRAHPHYRREAFMRGLERVGYSVTDHELHAPRPQDLLVIWNRYGTAHENAKRFEKAGAKVLVCENGYLGQDDQARQFYAIALNEHNGAGRWNAGGPERWARLGVEFAPWRTQGEHILVCLSRGFGHAGVAMPLDWPREIETQVRRYTKRPVRVRPHPGQSAPAALAADLKGAWAVVIWNSACGVQALAAGVPVVACSPHWILKGLAAQLSEVDAPPLPERLPAFERLAWAQWRVAEIETGEPFRRLLSAAGQGEVAAAA